MMTLFPTIDWRGSSNHRKARTQPTTIARKATLRMRMPPTLRRLRRLLPRLRECLTAISYGHQYPNHWEGEDTTLVAVVIPVRNCLQKGKYLKYPADTYLCLARDASRVGKRLHKYYLLITYVRCDHAHRKSTFPIRNLDRLWGCGYLVLNWESEVHRPCAPRINIESQWQPRK
jgi:hypothetical protein